MRMRDLTGLIFNKLTVIQLLQKRNCSHVIWTCRCNCGSIVNIRSNNLVNGHTKSCGCIRKEIHIKHGDTHKGKISKEFWAWANIIQRCYNNNVRNYKDYGGRGIKISSKWRNDFKSFLDYVGRAPSCKHSIDRIDNNGDYEPGNVRWATSKEQANNRRHR